MTYKIVTQNGIPFRIPVYTKDELTVQKIRKRYSLDEELAIQRQRDTKPQEFKEYFDYCELCKQQAKEELIKETK